MEVDFSIREVGYSVILFVLIIFSAFFSSSETAFMRANRFRIRHLADNGRKDAKRVVEILKKPDKLISTILLGNNFVNVLASAIATALFLSVFGEEGIVYASIAMTIILLIFAEITPKTVAAYKADEFSMLVSYSMRAVIRILDPLAHLLTMISKGLLQLFGFKLERTDKLTEADVETVISIGHKEGFIQEPKAKMLSAVMDMDTVPVRKVMIPMNEIQMLSTDCSFDDIVRTVISKSFSRYPVYEGRQDNILGYLHVRDIWRFIDRKEDFDLKKALREVEFVPETRSILKQLIDFQQMRVHIAFVVDEYGTVKGAITLEDIIEEITGDIIDEHDDILAPVIPVGLNTFLVRGNINLRDLGKYFDNDFPEEFDTLSGLMYSMLDHIPEEGEEMDWDGMRFKVERMRGNRLSRVRIRIRNTGEDQEN